MGLWVGAMTDELEQRLRDLQLDIVGIPGGPITFEMFDRAMKLSLDLGAELARAKEREDCAVLVENHDCCSCSNAANAIRARGNGKP